MRRAEGFRFAAVRRAGRFAGDRLAGARRAEARLAEAGRLVVVERLAGARLVCGALLAVVRRLG